MLGNFSYCNPTKLYFGEDAVSNLSEELKNLCHIIDLSCKMDLLNSRDMPSMYGT